MKKARICTARLPRPGDDGTAASRLRRNGLAIAAQRLRDNAVMAA